MQKTQTPAQRILDLRGDLGLNQGAPEFGVSQAAWSRVERGETLHPRIKIKKGIARKLGVSVEEIWGSPNDIEPQEREQPPLPQALRGDDVDVLLDMTVPNFRVEYRRAGKLIGVETEGRVVVRQGGVTVTLEGAPAAARPQRRPRARRDRAKRRSAASSSDDPPGHHRPASGHRRAAAQYVSPRFGREPFEPEGA